MSRNGSGTYNLPAGNPVVTGSTISSTWANNTLNDIATALTGSIAKDGQTTPTGNLPMGGYAHTNVADATVRTMYGTAGQIQDSAFTFLTSPAGTNSMTATAALGMSSYVTGQRFFFVAPSTNTGACTLNINAIGAKALTKNGTTALVAGDIVSGAVIQVVYDGTQFQLVSPAGVLGTMAYENSNNVSITGGSILATGTIGSVSPNIGSTGAFQVVDAAGNPNSCYIQATNNARNSEYCDLHFHSNGTIYASGGFNATSFTGDGSNLTGTANSFNAGIGVNQSWIDVTSSRALNTTYTNSTGKPIMVGVQGVATSTGPGIYGIVGGVTLYTMGGTTIGQVICNTFMVPAGATYSAGSVNLTLQKWVELR